MAATAATYIGDAPVITNFRMMRGDGNDHAFTVVHSFGAAANVAEVRFFVRTEPDGDAVVLLTLTDNASQIDLTTDDECTISLEPEDTDGKVCGKHWYDVELRHTDDTIITFQRGYFELMPDMANDFGGAVVPNTPSAVEILIWWTLGEMWAGTFTRNSDNVVTSAAIIWPDGSGGTFTATTINSTFNAVDAFTATHSLSGLTVTQSAVTRNSDGAVTVRPIPTVA